jgi:hypothetical protein
MSELEKLGMPSPYEEIKELRAKLEIAIAAIERAIRWIEIAPNLKMGEEWNDLQFSRDALKKLVGE